MRGWRVEPREFVTIAVGVALPTIL